ncbi:uncharacterized protein LOC126897298 [Daktulosphaira vitifoliae]|uniref:uncharacterized protein LOC126897298 n=1 Tax=Daktulosphaira vitifoliae TaxID=58002 RepID=UPI0021AA1C19|nr:uncharacterized protein LOC126897298 [Daktulosphaira vitifoliae]
MNYLQTLKSSNNNTNEKEVLPNILTQHFFLYIMYLREAYDKFNQPLNKTLVQAWINRLLGTPHPDIQTAMLRNMYLSQFIMNLIDGKLEDPFTKNPPSGPLSELNIIYNIKKESTESKEIYKNLGSNITNRELPLKTLNQLSSDRRTYVSIRHLENGTVLFGYIAITIGDVNDEPLWVDDKGNPVQYLSPNAQDLPVVSLKHDKLNDVKTIDSSLKDLANDVWEVLSQRRKPEIRKRAKDFYVMIYNNIEQEMLREENTNSIECRDPYVEKLIQFLLDDMSMNCVRDPEEFRRFNMLSILKKRIKRVIQEIEERQVILEKVQTQNSTLAMQLILQPATLCQDFMTLMAVQDAIKGQPTVKITDLLFVQYPPCVVNTVLKLITQEKLHIMQLIKSRLDNILREMYKELRESILRGLKSYKNSRVEWKRTWGVVKEYEDISECIVSLLTTVGNVEARENFIVTVENEMIMTLQRLKTANMKTEQLEQDIRQLHKNVHDLNEKLEMEKKMIAEQNDLFVVEIANEKKAIDKRKATIEKLKFMAIDDIVKDKN